MLPWEEEAPVTKLGENTQSRFKFTNPSSDSRSAQKLELPKEAGPEAIRKF